MTSADTGVRRHRPRTAGPSAGDLRRERLLAALNDLLQERSLTDIGISDIARRAELSRSASYFYFPSKAAAVAALLGDMYENIFRVAPWFDEHSGDALRQLRSGIEQTAAMWRSRPTLMVAMLDAVNDDADVKATWMSWLAAFEERTAARLAADQAAGIARTDVDVETLSRILVGVIFRAMEDDVRNLHSGRAPWPHLVDTVYDVWRRSAYRDDSA